MRHEIRPIKIRYLISSLRSQQHQSGEVSLFFPVEIRLSLSLNKLFKTAKICSISCVRFDGPFEVKVL